MSKLLFATSIVLLSGCASYESEVSAPDHDIEVVANDIAKADGLAFHPTGAILATEEYRGGGVVRIDPVSGQFTHIVRDLDRPDNIVVTGGAIYLTEESTEGRIAKIDFREEVTTFVSDLEKPEGLDLGPDGKLYVAEHVPDGRVYRISLDGTRETVGKVTDGEGLRALADGRVCVAETSLGRISCFLPDGTKQALSQGAMSAPDGVAYDPDNNRLLVTEDAAPGRMLAVDLASGSVSVIATGMDKPQTMLIEADGSILVAEQGEDRILRLRPRVGVP